MACPWGSNTLLGLQTYSNGPSEKVSNDLLQHVGDLQTPYNLNHSAESYTHHILTAQEITIIDENSEKWSYRQYHN